MAMSRVRAQVFDVLNAIVPLETSSLRPFGVLE
jgi:hypothetical protein